MVTGTLIYLGVMQNGPNNVTRISTREEEPRPGKKCDRRDIRLLNTYKEKSNDITFVGLLVPVTD